MKNYIKDIKKLMISNSRTDDTTVRDIYDYWETADWPKHRDKLTPSNKKYIGTYLITLIKFGSRFNFLLSLLEYPYLDEDEIEVPMEVSIDEFGFLLEAHLKLRPVEFAMDGIYLCGSVRWPTDVAEGIAQAYAAAAKAAGPLRMGYVKPEAITAVVNPDICSGCGICVAVCPFGALSLVPTDDRFVSEVTVAQCKGCGTCGATCPSGAITTNHFTNQQLMAELEAFAA